MKKKILQHQSSFLVSSKYQQTSNKRNINQFQTRYLKPLSSEDLGNQSNLVIPYSSVQQQSHPIEIYFNQNKKKEHIKNIIDCYFDNGHQYDFMNERRLSQKYNLTVQNKTNDREANNFSDYQNQQKIIVNSLNHKNRSIKNQNKFNIKKRSLKVKGKKSQNVINYNGIEYNNSNDIKINHNAIDQNTGQIINNSLNSTFPKGFNPETMQHSNQPVEMSKTFLSDNHVLPPIIQSADDPEELDPPFQMALSSLLLLEDSQIQEKCGTVVSQQQSLNHNNPVRKSKLVQQNQLFKLYCIYSISNMNSTNSSKFSINNQLIRIPTLLQKEYKQQCRQIFLRQQNIKSILENSEVNLSTPWTASAMLCCSSPYIQSLKSRLYQIHQQSIKAQKIYKITIKQNKYNLLFMNDNQILLNIIKDVCQILVKIKGKIINNKISLGNIYYVNTNNNGDQKILLGEWGHSALKQSVQFGKQNVTSVMNPIIKGKNQWFVTPEYLPPQFLEYVVGIKDYDIWQYPSSIDMWSLGCALFQMITLVPLWISTRCLLNHKKRIFRRGLFHSRTRDIQEIINKQRKFCTNFMLHYEKLQQLEERVNFKVIQLLKRMLEINHKQRLTPQQALKIIG